MVRASGGVHFNSFLNSLGFPAHGFGAILDLAHGRAGKQQVSSRWHSGLSHTQSCSSRRKRHPNNGTFAKRRKEIIIKKSYLTLCNI